MYQLYNLIYPGKKAKQELSLIDHVEWISTYLQKNCLGKFSGKKNAFLCQVPSKLQLLARKSKCKLKVNLKSNHHLPMTCISSKYSMLLKLPNSMGRSQLFERLHIHTSLGLPGEATPSWAGLQVEPGAMLPNPAKGPPPKQQLFWV